MALETAIHERASSSRQRPVPLRLRRVRNRGGCGDGDTSIAVENVAKMGGVDVEESAVLFNEAKLLELAYEGVHT